MKHIIGLYKPMAGNIYIEGESIVTAVGAARARLQRKLGVMYQSGALFGSMTVLDNVRFPLNSFTDLDEDAKILTARMQLRMVDLSHAEPLHAGGTVRRHAQARRDRPGHGARFQHAAARRTLAGLDPITAANLDQTILSLRRNLGFTCIVVTHELNSIFAIAE